MAKQEMAKQEMKKIKSDVYSFEKRSNVISVHSAKATTWDYEKYPYVDSIDTQVVDEMLNAAIVELTEEDDVSSAWSSLFESYKKGEIIAIKPNFNDLYAGFRGFVTSPAIINSILDGLVNKVGVDPSDIYLYDCTRSIPNEFRKRINTPINFIEPYSSSYLRKTKYRLFGNPFVKADFEYEIKMKSDVRNKSGEHVKCYLPRIITMAEHIINVPILKSHQFVSHSGALKNHYGTVRFSDGIGGPVYIHPPIIQQSISDVNAHEQIRTKTRLIVMDALFGRLNKYGGGPDRWNIFGRANPNRLIVSQDPVALDSVSRAIIKDELISRGEKIHSHEYLQIANDAGLGVYEEPDSTGRYKDIKYKEIAI